MAKADRRVSFILSGPFLRLDTLSECHDRGGTIRGWGGPGMAAIFGPRGPILRGDHPRRYISTATGMQYVQIISQSYYMTNPGIWLAPDLPFFAKVGLQPTT